jgi:uncharacterized membrane protein
MSLTFEIIYFFLIGILLLSSFLLNEVFKLLKKNNLHKQHEESSGEIKIVRVILFCVALILLAAYFVSPILEKSGLSAHLIEWLSLVIRWSHVVLGIAWIGASFYFIFLENSLNRTKNLRDELTGNLWAIHGGGFYYVEKYKGAPEVIPEKLHWFKYEAYFTWLTGIILLTLVYYLNAKSFMVDASVNDISPGTATLIGIGSLITGWFIYDLMCRSPLLAKPKLFGLIGLIIMIGISFVLTRFLSGRAAFIHVGALMGTIMAGNVFFTIIPSQKDLVHAAKNKLPLNLERAKIAGLRSLHNNYITLPVIFIMISNHFPGTFAPVYNWGILAGLTIGSVAVRHFINLYEKEKADARFLIIGAIALFALVFVTAPKSIPVDNTPVAFAEVQPIFQKRCETCHSAHPTDDVQKTAPNGITFDTPEQISKMKDRIHFRAVQTKTMPQGNKTGITDSERELIGRWINQGAKIN